LNAHARKQASLRAIIAEVVDETRLRKIINTLADRAEQGHLDYAKLLLDYLLGRPGAAPDPDLLDLAEWHIRDAQPTKFEYLRAMLDSVPAGAANALLNRHPQTDDEILNGIASAGQDVAVVMAARDKRAGRKRKPSAPLGG
jgi:hypothetical protein